jgi:hypothetical protein
LFLEYQALRPLFLPQFQEAAALPRSAAFRRRSRTWGGEDAGSGDEQLQAKGATLATALSIKQRSLIFNRSRFYQCYF